VQSTYTKAIAHISYVQTPTLINFLEVCKKAKFRVNESGYLDAPESIIRVGV
jgi:hypothetical protein